MKKTRVSDTIIKMWIENEEFINIWVEGEFQECCQFEYFNQNIVRVKSGNCYFRDNADFFKGKAMKVLKFKH